MWSVTLSTDLCFILSMDPPRERDIYIYIENPSKNCPFLSWKSVQHLPFFCFCFSTIFSFCRENEIFQKKKKKKKTRKEKTIFCVENPSNYVAQHTWTDFQRNLGRIYNSTILLILGLFFLFESAETTICIVFSAKMKFLNPPPKIKLHYLWTQLR